MRKLPEQMALDDSWILSSDDELFYKELFEDPLDLTPIKTLDEILMEFKIAFEAAEYKWKECDA